MQQPPSQPQVFFFQLGTKNYRKCNLRILDLELILTITRRPNCCVTSCFERLSRQSRKQKQISHQLECSLISWRRLRLLRRKYVEAFA